MFKFYFKIVIVLLVLNQLSAQEDELMNEPGSAFYFELGGKPFYSINVDFQILETNRLSIGTQYAYKMLIPNIMYYGLKGDGNWKTEYGAGLSYLPINSDEYKFGAFLIHGVLGYRYQKKNGFLFRAGFTPIIHPRGFIPMIGISFGYSL